jgi:hypothetical protein
MNRANPEVGSSRWSQFISALAEEARVSTLLAAARLPNAASSSVSLSPARRRVSRARPGPMPCGPV